MAEEPVHPIVRWCKAHKVSQAHFGRLLGVKRATVSRWVTGRGLPTPELAFKVVRVTDGEITFEQMMDPWGVAAKRASAVTSQEIPAVA